MDRDYPASLPKNEIDNIEYGKGLQRKLCNVIFTSEVSDLKMALRLEFVDKAEKSFARPKEEYLKSLGIPNLEVDRARDAVETYSRIIQEKATVLADYITPYYRRKDFPVVVKSDKWLALYAKAEALAKDFGREYKQLLEDSKARMKAVGTAKEFDDAREHYCAGSLKLSHRIAETAMGMGEELKALLV